MDDATIERLRELAPWPSEKPFPDARFVERGEHGGLEIVFERVARDRPFWILEIGAEFGGSSRAFLDLGPEVRVISADMWPDNYWLKPVWKDLAQYTRQPGGMLRLFQTYCWEYRDRLFPVRGTSCDGLRRLHAIGVRPDLIYVDGDHTHDGVFQDLAVANALFPDAILCGDDWEYRPTHPRYEGMEVPVQYAVKRFALHHQHDLVVRGTTWVMDPTRPPSFAPPLPRPYEIAGRLDKLGPRFDAIEARLEALAAQDAAQTDLLARQVRATEELAKQLRAATAPRRKLRKLVADPVRFIQDSRLARALRGSRD